MANWLYGKILLPKQGTCQDFNTVSDEPVCPAVLTVKEAPQAINFIKGDLRSQLARRSHKDKATATVLSLTVSPFWNQVTEAY